MDTMNDYNSWNDRDLYDSTGSKIGTITDVFTDDVSGRPEWLAVKTGWFGTNISLVPIQGVTQRTSAQGGDGMDLMTNLDKDTIKNAPNVDDTSTHLSSQDEQLLYKHYGFNWDDRDSKHFGYGNKYAKAERFDRDYETINQQVTTQATVPVEANVRLRRYTTQGTKQVTVPTTEEHVEVEGVDAKTQQTQQRRN